jgi:hypothetical protein
MPIIRVTQKAKVRLCRIALIGLTIAAGGIAWRRIEAHSGDEGKITTVLVEVPLANSFDWKEKPAREPGARSLNLTKQTRKGHNFYEK